MSESELTQDEKLYAGAMVLVIREQKASTSFIQRHLQIGYNRAATIIEELEKNGIVGAPNHVGKREVLKSAEHLEKCAELVGKITEVSERTGIPAEKIFADAKAKAKVDQRKEASIGHNSGETKDTGGVSGQRLKAFIERVERLEEEKKGLADDIKDIFAEAKAVGFDVKTMRKVIRLRKMDAEKRREEESLLELYAAAIGLQLSLDV